MEFCEFLEGVVAVGVVLSMFHEVAVDVQVCQIVCNGEPRGDAGHGLVTILGTESGHGVDVNVEAVFVVGVVVICNTHLRF